MASRTAVVAVAIALVGLDIPHWVILPALVLVEFPADSLLVFQSLAALEYQRRRRLRRVAALHTEQDILMARFAVVQLLLRKDIGLPTAPLLGLHGFDAAASGRYQVVMVAAADRPVPCLVDQSRTTMVAFPCEDRMDIDACLPSWIAEMGHDQQLLVMMK